MIALITDDDDSAYQQQLERVNYCDANYLELNISETKEMIIDFRNSSSTPSSIVLKGSSVEHVTSYNLQVPWHHDRWQIGTYMHM